MWQYALDAGPAIPLSISSRGAQIGFALRPTFNVSTFKFQIQILNMPDFREHVEFLISTPQDHSGDHALERWTSCVRVVCMPCKTCSLKG